MKGSVRCGILGPVGGGSKARQSWTEANVPVEL